MPPIPEDFDDLRDWRENDAPEWIGELIDDWQLGWETGYVFDEMGIRDIDEWDSVRIDAESADHWEITISYDDGTQETIDFGDAWEQAWDLYDLAYGYDDVEAERGDIDYNDD